MARNDAQQALTRPRHLSTECQGMISESDNLQLLQDKLPKQLKRQCFTIICALSLLAQISAFGGISLKNTENDEV